MKGVCTVLPLLSVLKNVNTILNLLNLIVNTVKWFKPLLLLLCTVVSEGISPTGKPI